MLKQPLIRKLLTLLFLVLLSAVVSHFDLLEGNDGYSHDRLSPALEIKPPPQLPNEIPTRTLPKEALDTIKKIKLGGPFPYERDGVIFQNRERRLPIQKKGYYREYTVITPGSTDRGARRMIQGAGGEFYYTEDHYQTFKQIDPP